MRWIKAPEELKATLEQLMAPIDCERRPMFGYPCYFINRNMFAGLFQDKLFVRLSPSQVSRLTREFPEIRNLEPMPGRPMRDYHVIPSSLYGDSTRMPALLGEAVAWCTALPAKKPPSRKAAGQAQAATPKQKGAGKGPTRPAKPSGKAPKSRGARAS